MKLDFDITENTKLSDDKSVKVAKFSYSLGCLKVLINQCEHTIKVLNSLENKREYKKEINQALIDLTKYQNEKTHIEDLLSLVFENCDGIS